jgi:hypothetical protein
MMMIDVFIVYEILIALEGVVHKDGRQEEGDCERA